MAGGDKAQLFEPIDTSGYPCFCLQFFVTGQLGGVDGLIKLKVSNDGTTFKEISNTLLFTSQVTMDALGNGTYFIFVGTASGVGNVTHITASFKANTITGGTIDKVLFAAELGSS